ncbi:angiopoietin-like protein 8 [Ictidomys tridecemlineatus]|uniref:Angiopoietin like 8 n=1 Tax=Ictidomys tridecemlineatus TaxID=43179 RepID=I3NGP6_ICTTR|nr:angiopoietin-like protein 8 [Ictidomys tridecemlineatus]KAG3280278.1 angiopoietin like 8 [Ictidomys tridecemlineatus]
MPALTLCLLWALAAVAQPAPVAPMGGLEPAQHEELTLLFHGALQLGQALNGVYKSTEARLTEAGQSLGLYGQALGLLGLQVSQGRDAAQELRTSLLEIQLEEDDLQLQAEATAQVLSEVAQAQRVLRDSVQRLEAQLQGAWLGHARQEFEALKAHADKQSYFLWALTGHVQRQRQEMAAQQQWLRRIQERLHTAALPA